MTSVWIYECCEIDATTARLSKLLSLNVWNSDFNTVNQIKSPHSSFKERLRKHREPKKLSVAGGLNKLVYDLSLTE